MTTTQSPQTRKKVGRFFHELPRGNANARALVFITVLMVTFGTIMMASASEGQAAANGGSPWSLMLHDTAYLIIGFFAFYASARVRIDQLVRKAPLLISVGLGMLMAVYLVGVSANGGKRWLNLKAINLQPSEIFKFMMVFFIAWLIEHKHNELNNWKQLAVLTSPVTVGAALILLEPDIGTSSVVLVIAFSMLAIGGLSKWIQTRVAVLSVISFFGYMAMKPYSAQRFLAFLHPSQNLASSGYQLYHSKIGFGAGGVAGLGLGHSREKWGFLPNPHTDFIYTIVGEELGVIGSLVVIALFLAFLFAAVRIAQRCTNQSYRFIVIGITTWIIFESIVNIASVVGWWAVTGIPLPFFSYGGTALITELAAVGILYNIAHDTSRSGDLTFREYADTDFRAEFESRTQPRQARPRSYRDHQEY